MNDGSLRAMSGRRWAWEWIKSIAIGTALFLLLRTFVLEAFRIPSGSMENTLLAGDYVLVNKVIYGPKLPFTHWSLPGISVPERGDIVVFEPPHDEGSSYVKRLVAVPGDTVEMQNRELRVNGDPVPEPYALRSSRQDVHPASALWQCRFMPELHARHCDPSRDTWGPVVVPENQYLVLGDNRDDSDDSRYWGFVPRDAIRGRPLVVYFSVDPRQAHDESSWSDRVRWDRIGHALD